MNNKWPLLPSSLLHFPSKISLNRKLGSSGWYNNNIRGPLLKSTLPKNMTRVFTVLKCFLFWLVCMELVISVLVLKEKRVVLAIVNWLSMIKDKPSVYLRYKCH
ncbi:hypothetical protein F4703DRAFT_1795128 [Phycomyces blakesleeanus]